MGSLGREFHRTPIVFLTPTLPSPLPPACWGHIFTSRGHSVIQKNEEESGKWKNKLRNQNYTGSISNPKPLLVATFVNRKAVRCLSKHSGLSLTLERVPFPEHTPLGGGDRPGKVTWGKECSWAEGHEAVDRETRLSLDVNITMETPQILASADSDPFLSH